LIVHGSRDDAVAAFLAEEIFVGLRRLGKEVVYLRYEGEGHMLEGHANQVDYVTRMLEWFDEHLKAPRPASASGSPK
jgi:dipeptidyl aminopeptidase/acylaminoacyl peptidase